MELTYHYSIKNPNLKNTGYIVAIANLQDKHDRSTPSHHHWKILKCRMIIFSNSSILACPDKNDVKQVHIVFNKVGDDYDKLNSLFIKFSLTQDGAIRSTTPEIFQMCFTYTMTAKIAPTWNLLGYHYLVNNRDFLTTNGLQEGVKFAIASNEHCTDLELKPVNVNLIKASGDISAGEYIRVLPSLNKAVVEECNKTLPEVGSFKSYKDIRRHWKNIHGYRLPDEETSYYMIRFWRGEPLTYPDVCVTRHFPIITPMPKPKEEVVLSRFLSCLKSKIPHFLGIPTTVQIKESMENVQASVPSTADRQIFGSFNFRKNIEAKISDGDLKGAARLLFSSDVLSPDTPDTFSALQSKHPPAPSTPYFLDPPTANQVANERTPEAQSQYHPISLCTPTQNPRPFKY